MKHGYNVRPESKKKFILTETVVYNPDILRAAKVSPSNGRVSHAERVGVFTVDVHERR